MFLAVVALLVGHAFTACPDTSQCGEERDHTALLQVRTVNGIFKAVTVGSQEQRSTKQHGTPSPASGKASRQIEVLLVCITMIVTWVVARIVYWLYRYLIKSSTEVDADSARSHTMEPPASTQPDKALRRNFQIMAITFGIGHAGIVAAMAFASSLLDQRVSYVGNGILYVLIIPYCLLFSVPVTLRLGLKGSLVLGLLGYAIYMVSFALSVMSVRGGYAQWFCFCIGSTIGGIAGGMLWTAQGAYMAQSAAAISEDEEQQREVVNGELATLFAFYYLLFELINKLLFSALLYLGVSAVASSWILSIGTWSATVGMTMVPDLKSGMAYGQAAHDKMLAAPRLWSNVSTWLLSPTNLTFGFSSAFVTGYFNANYGTVQLGSASIGLVTSFIVLVAMAASTLYGSLRQHFGIGLPLSLGAVSFALIPTLVLATGCPHWGLWLLVIYALQGSGRASYENTNKALFADTFPGADTEGAFANCFLQFSLASALQFFMSAVFSGTTLEVVILVCALLTPIAYFVHMAVSDTPTESEKKSLFAP